ncbi:Ornithine aminotransferase, mitochondrial [Atta colombica]|uniref:Ornithine aminotransferase n=1 Tax=Atta colombica TaxID=520822 RepID=A0A195BBH3_9HYME|nr:Ornithine aminotransferase, mitochondrial [Atta colombica]
MPVFDVKITVFEALKPLTTRSFTNSGLTITMIVNAISSSIDPAFMPGFEVRNVLWIADEVQTDLARTGKRIAMDYENVKPNIGFYPVSGILANDSLKSISYTYSDSTYSDNSLECKIAFEALFVLEEEKLAENAEKKSKKIITLVRGKGLLNIIVINEKIDAWDICVKLKENGLFAKLTRTHSFSITVNYHGGTNMRDIISKILTYT